MNPILENLLIMFGLAPLLIGTWWGMVLLVNRSMDFDLQKVYAKIYKDPIAAAILRVGTIGTIAYLVSQSFGRIV